jgi:integrase
MRIRESYGLYKRLLSSGRVVYYYRTYYDGKRTCGHSTGQTTKTAAREYCNRLLREGKLHDTDSVSGFGGRDLVPLFKDFADGFWDYETSDYLKSRRRRRPITKTYAAQGEYAVRKHLIPVFGDKRLNAITVHDVDSWLAGFTDREYATGANTTRRYKCNTANLVFRILKIMLNYAVKQGLIAVNPCYGIEKLNVDDERKIEILSPEEVVKLFPADWGSIWDDSIFYVLNKLAACTGMRHGELLGLRGEFVYKSHIDVCAQYNRYGYQDVKTHRPRSIPIPSGLWKDMEPLLRKNGDGYLFSRDGGQRPVSRKCVYKSFYNALNRIGIDDEERRRRNLSMHSWRHFLNTILLMANIPDSKVMSVTGHSTKKMKERYTHFDNTKMDDIIMVQENLFVA